MHSSTPYPPVVTWATNTSTTIPSHLLPTASVNMPHQQTPSDIAQYLAKMDFSKYIYGTQEYWQPKGSAGYMTWEQAVTYCLIKPWLTSGSGDDSEVMGA